MATALAAFGVVVALGACGTVAHPGTSAKASPRDPVVARVDGQAVTQADVDLVRAEARLAGREKDAAQGRAEAVRRVLVRREARRIGAVPARSAVEARLSAVRERVGGEEALIAALAAARMTRAQLTAATEYSLLEKNLRDAKYGDLVPTAREVQVFYRRLRPTVFTRSGKVRLGDITLPGRPLAEKVGAEIAKGMPFTSAARRFSMDTTTRYAGGLLGWISLPTLPREVRAAIAGLSQGEVTRPVRTFGRWHLYKLFRRRPAVVTPLHDVAAVVRAELTRRLRVAALDAWVRRARQRANIELSP
jgi:foldase protein PrsA